MPDKIQVKEEPFKIAVKDTYNPIKLKDILDRNNISPKSILISGAPLIVESPKKAQLKELFRECFNLGVEFEKTFPAESFNEWYEKREEEINGNFAL